jgi:hypothetical protein
VDRTVERIHFQASAARLAPRSASMPARNSAASRGLVQ